MHARLECDSEHIGELTLKYNCEMEKINGLIQVCGCFRDVGKSKVMKLYLFSCFY